MDTTAIEQFINAFQDVTQTFTAKDVVFTIILSFVLSLIIAWTYRGTHHGTSYSQTFVQTLVIVSMVVGIVMLIVGSNIARAFTLLGALSIIRFRNAVKETRDVGFIFFAMAIGMACGTRSYGLAIISTLIICALIWVMVLLDMFSKDASEQILKIRLPADIPYDNLFEDTFNKYVDHHNLIAVETVKAGTLHELVFGVEMKKKADQQAFISELRQLNDNNKVTLISGMYEVDL
ncbi:MAG: DUF4956 domain-containing protein [Chloroflexota bacterium]|nr:DUF4956 domain-containing protein [Chloroflexota bacterium]